MGSWKERGTCWKSEDRRFFSTDTEEQAAVIEEYCRVCPVVAECLDYAIKNRETSGVWGGLPENRVRRKVRGYRSRADLAKQAS